MRARRPAAGCFFLVTAFAGAVMAASPTAWAAESADQRPSVSNQESAPSPDVWRQVREPRVVHPDLGVGGGVLICHCLCGDGAANAGLYHNAEVDALLQRLGLEMDKFSSGTSTMRGLDLA